VAAWAAAVLVSTVFLFFYAGLLKDYLDRVTATRLHGETLTVPLQQVPQGFAADGETWIRHAIALTEGHSLRLRETDIDNAPFGREVQWNSAWAWWLAGLGHLRASITGEPLPAAIERAAFWANLPVLLVVLVGFSAWAGRRFGATGAVVTALAIVGHRGFYEGFYPAYPDHHGIIGAAILGLILGAVFMGAGWWRDAAENQPSLLPRSRALALRAATVSAVFGALGLWISAASVVIPVALVGIAGLTTALLAGRDLQSIGAVAEPAVWRRWSRVGAAASFAFYLLEYAPHFTMRLEVNHPLYSLAWLGGGELVALVLAWRAGTETSAPPQRLRWTLAALAVAAAPIALLIGGSTWFIPAEPFMRRIHAQIDEFQPLWVRMHELGWRAYRDHAVFHLLPFLAALLLLVRRPAPTARALILFALAVALPMTALGWLQNRWLLTAGGAQIILVMVLLAAWLSSWRPNRPLWLRAAAVIGVCAALYVTAPRALLHERLLVAAKNDVQTGEAMQLLYRDIAQRLHDDKPAGNIVLLASPNASTAIGYYGRFQTVGTFYWENHDGLRATAEIFSAATDAEAAQLIRRRGITHIAMVSNSNFLPEYFHALQPESPVENVKAAFGWRLLFNDHQPVWLQPIPYEVPPQFFRLRSRVRLFAVDDAVMDATPKTPQAAARRAWRLATSHDDSVRDGAEAVRLAQLAVQSLPASAAAREVLAAAFAENARWAEANGAILHAIELAENAGNAALAARLKARFTAYQNRRPWRE
jgi:hypothetical protein